MKFKRSTFELTHPARERLMEAARTSLEIALNIQPSERVLIMSNPDGDLPEIAKAMYNAALELNGQPVLLFQPARSRLDLAEPSTLGAIATEPEILFTITQESLGNDPNGLRFPYKVGNLTVNHIFYYLIAVKKARGAWCPSADVDTFCRTVPINYAEMWRLAGRLKQFFDNAESIHVHTDAGTDLVIDLRERMGMLDDGDYRYAGTGGNLPAGEVFAVPNTGSNGIAVIDGSAAVVGGTIKIQEPVKVVIENGKIIDIDGGEEARAIAETLEAMRKTTEIQVEQGVISRDMAESYRNNVNNLAEFGIGLNPAAVLRGNMTEDEKAYNTCHIAMGDDCYGIAPAVDHYDMVMKNPVFDFVMKDGSRRRVNPYEPE